MGALIVLNFLLLFFSINKVTDRSKEAHYEKPKNRIMSNTPIGYEDDPRNPDNNEEHECNVCGKPIEMRGLCNSRDCFKVDNN